MKNVLQDVIPPERKTIRNIPINGMRKMNDDRVLRASIEPDFFASKKTSWTKWWLLGVAVIIVVLVAFSTIFARATISIVPKQEKSNMTMNGFAVRKIDNKTEANDTGAQFTLAVVNIDGSKSTNKFEEKSVDKKASGEIIIFNNADTVPLRLIKNTRFESPDGLIYRIQKSITIPAKTTSPGSVVATVYADAPGEKYNLGLVDFTIPGFKGSDKYGKVYARSKTEMIGGFSGVMKIVDDSELEKIRGEIYLDLTNQLKDKIYTQIPKDSVLYNDGIFIDFESQPNVDLGDSIQVVEKGVLRAVLFDKRVLSNYVAKDVISDLNGGSVEIINIEEMKFEIKDRDNVRISDDDGFDFELSGEANFAWVFSEDEIKNTFTGQLKKNTNALLAKFTGIKEAEVTLNPFWKRSFPTNSNNIKIEKVSNLE